MLGERRSNYTIEPHIASSTEQTLHSSYAPQDNGENSHSPPPDINKHTTLWIQTNYSNSMAKASVLSILPNSHFIVNSCLIINRLACDTFN
ncbi:unnamed protein product [Rhizophagus irregularis]|nr:unnamed protein product [Rhizophagus irregularis]